jgi:cephalosporin hydroxylase
MSDFPGEVQKNVSALAADSRLWDKSLDWMIAVGRHRYTYNFQWLGRPIIQYPQDIVAFQELVALVEPDLIVETGIAHGGSLVLSASLLALLDVMEGKNPRDSARKVVGVDIDIRPHNRAALDNHPLRYKMQLIEGSSVDSQVVSQVHELASNAERVLVALDSNHTKDHVAAELDAYASLVNVGSYCIVFDTVVEFMSPEFTVGRDWGPGNSPKNAVDEFVKANSNFEIDDSFDSRLLVTVGRGGYLKRIS